MALFPSLTQFACWTGLAAVKSAFNSETGLACRYSVYFDQCFQISFFKFSTQKFSHTPFLHCAKFSSPMLSFNSTLLFTLHSTLSIYCITVKSKVFFSLLDFCYHKQSRESSLCDVTKGNFILLLLLLPTFSFFAGGYKQRARFTVLLRICIFFISCIRPLLVKF